MDDDGWIAREQILGPEARSKVPPEFQTQYPHYANPPTLFLVLIEFLNKLQAVKSGESGVKQSGNDVRSTYLEKPELAESYLRQLYPLLRRQYFWFKKTQWGDIKTYDREAFSLKEAYRWRGRTVEHILTSGIDDYPRPQPPHPGELHVDLISWMGMMTRSIKQIAEYLGEADDLEEFQKYEKAILRNIEDLHWDEKAKTYCDATIDEYEESAHVCHKGYVSLSPFITGLMGPEHPHLGDILNLINDPEELWSDFGIRSLSKSSELYGTGENYWRGPVWMNINYLVLKNLLVSGVGHFAISYYVTRLTNMFLKRIPPVSRGLTRNRPAKCTLNFARTLLRTSLRNGRRRDSPGSSTTPNPAKANVYSTSRAGPVWW